MAADTTKFEFTKFEFTLLPVDTLGNIRSQSRETVELLQKWGFEGRMKFATFTYNKHFQAYLKDSFVLDFFQNATVNSTLEVLSSSGQWSPLSMGSGISAITVEEVPCTILNMDFFDRLYSNGVVKKSGSIAKCFDEMWGDFLVSDELKKMLIVEDSDNYDDFGENRSQFLFRIFKHMVLGGPVNQYEDMIRPYLDVTKLLYKELLTVVKDINTKKLSIASTVLNVQAKVDDHIVFPQKAEHEQSFCYLIIDNIKRHVTTWYHVWS